MRTGPITLAAAALALAGAAPAHAAFTPVTKAGATPADIQASVNAYRTTLGDDDGALPGSQSGGRREIDWEGAPDALPATYYNVTSPRGAELSTPGSGLATSAGFKDRDPSYDFPAFSGERLFAPVGANVTDVTFRVPGTDTPALVDGFAAVFSSVDQADRTRIDYFDAAGAMLGDVTALPGDLSFAGASGASIARVRITTGTAPLAAGTPDDAAHDVVAVDDLIYGEPRAPMADFHLGQTTYAAHEVDGTVTLAVRRSGALGAGSVRVTTVPGTADADEDFGAVDRVVSFAPGVREQAVAVPLTADTDTEGDETFTVALDRPAGGIVGTPASATVTIHDDPPAKAVKRRDRTPPRVTVTRVPSTMRPSRFAKGVRFRVKTNEAASLDVALVGRAGRAHISRSYNLTLAHRHSAAARGTRTLRLRPNRTLLGTARRFRVRLRVLAQDRAGNRRTVSKTIRVRPARR